MPALASTTGLAATLNALATEQITRWIQKAKSRRDAHHVASVRLDRRYYTLGVCATVLSCITAIQKSTELPPKVQLAITFVAIISPVVTGLGTVLNFSKRAEEHRRAFAKYEAVKLEAEAILVAASTPDATTLDAAVEHLKKLLTDATAQAPGLSRSDLREEPLELEAPPVSYVSSRSERLRAAFHHDPWWPFSSPFPRMNRASGPEEMPQRSSASSRRGQASYAEETQPLGGPRDQTKNQASSLDDTLPPGPVPAALAKTRPSFHKTPPSGTPVVETPAAGTPVARWLDRTRGVDREIPRRKQ
jgi:hypothetical protein